MNYEIGDFTLEDLKTLFEEVEKRNKEYRESRKKHLYDLPAAYGASLSCEELKAIVKIGYYRFMGGTEAVGKLREKCKDCGIN